LGYIREASPLFDSPSVSLPLKGEEEEILERGFAPLFPTLPLPLIREGGLEDRLAKQFHQRKFAEHVAYLLICN